MSGQNQKRIAKELSEITTSPPTGTTVILVDESDIHTWRVIMEGPTSSPYAGGHFTLLLTLPLNYPFSPPTLSFTTKVYHPNITNDDKGAMCLGLLRPDLWKPSTKVREVLEFARSVLGAPIGEDAVEANIGREFREEKGVWEKKAREWTKLYAKKEGK